MDKILQKLPKVQKNVLLKDYTTYKIGGPAKYFFVAKSKEDLMVALQEAKNFKLPVFILGGGSNLLVSDKGFKGFVIKIDILGAEFRGNVAFVGAGVSLTKLAYLSANEGLSGLEWAAGIPSGTIGGSIYGSAQAFGTKMADTVKEVEALDIKTFKVKKLSNRQCKFSLKNSIFKKNKNLVIISAVLELKKEDTDKIKHRIKEFIQYRKNGHPLNFPSAGSTFVNPQKKITNKNLLVKFPELNEYNKKGVIPAGYLIAKSGLAGRKIGKAQISEKHSNFIINLGGAKAKDVLGLISLAKKDVKNIFGIELEPEVQFIEF